MTLADQILQKGHQEGHQEGLQEGILEALQIRFDRVPDGLREVVEAIHDQGRLRSLHKASIQAATIEDFTRSL